MNDEKLRTLCNAARAELDRLVSDFQRLQQSAQEIQRQLEIHQGEIISAQSVWAAYATALGDPVDTGTLSERMLKILSEPLAK